MPSYIPPLPAATAAASISPAPPCASSAALCTSLSASASGTLPDTPSPLALVLGSLAGGQSLSATSTERILIGAGLPTIPKAMLDKIQRWEFVDLVDLLPAPSTYDAMANSTSQAHFTLFPGCELVRPKRRQILSIVEWVQAFTVYTAAIVQKFPAAVNELLAYQLTIIKSAQQYDGLQWRAYDTHFRISAAATGNRQWSRLDTDLYTRFFTGRAKLVSPCSLCDSTTHSAADCPNKKARKRDQLQGGKSSPLPLAKRRKWPTDVCAEFNTRGSCSFGPRCKYRHACGICSGDHPAKSCTAGSSKLEQQM